MASQAMTKVAVDDVQPDSGAVYNETKTLTAGDATEYIFPIKDIITILPGITGDGKLWFTFSSPVVIEAGTAVYYEWNESDEINVGATGFKVVWTSGTVVATVTVKTRNS